MEYRKLTINQHFTKLKKNKALKVQSIAIIGFIIKHFIHKISSFVL